LGSRYRVGLTALRFCCWLPAFPDRIFAATVDHGLRPESAQEAAFVALLCQSMGVPHTVLTVASTPDGNLQAWARKERYIALECWAIDRNIAAILTGHHADDQLETLIMRLNRGSGVAGLAAIRERQGRVVRPLLHWRQSELEALVDHAGLTPVRDPSNADDRFDRARLRRALRNADFLDPLAATRSSSALSHAEDALAWAANKTFAERAVVAGDQVTVDPTDIPIEIARRVVQAAIRSINRDAVPRGEDVGRLLEALESGGVATLAGVRCAGGALWRFSVAPPHRKN
jgi:tRNA(Ile)-lysidine synthase